MKSTRRTFLAGTALAVGGCGLFSGRIPAGEAAEPGLGTGGSRMKLGIVTYNLGREWDIETIIRNCTEARIDGVELRTTHAHGVEVHLNPEQRAAVRQRFADSAVTLHSLGSAFDFHTPNQAKLRHDIAATKEYILLARDVGATGIKVRPNGLPREVPVEKTLEQIGLSLRELGRFAADHGQQIRLEVHGNGTSELPRIRKIIDIADQPQVGVCWNSNPTDLAGDGFDANFDLVKDRIVLVHMRDLFIEDYPFRRLLARLQRTGYGGFTLLEIPESRDPVRVMKYARGLWLAYQGLL